MFRDVSQKNKYYLNIHTSKILDIISNIWDFIKTKYFIYLNGLNYMNGLLRSFVWARNVKEIAESKQGDF